MKNEFIIGLCLIGVIIGFSVLSGWLPQSDTDMKSTTVEPLPDTLSGEVLGGQSSSKIILDPVIPDAPGTVMVYKTFPPEVTKAGAIEFAKKFNMTDLNEPNEGDRGISVSSKNMRYNVMLYKNGGSRYSDYRRIDTPNGLDLLENLPSDEEAEEIAATFLKERNLLPDSAVFRKSIHSKAYRLNHSGGEPTVVHETIELGYSRSLNGMNVEGTQFMVGVGAHGDIISFFANWKDYQPLGEYPIISGEAAFEKLQQQGIAAGSGTVRPDTFAIGEVYLAYRTKALAYPEDYLEPVWVFKGEATADGKSLMPFEEYIPALTDDAVKSLNL